MNAPALGRALILAGLLLAALGAALLAGPRLPLGRLPGDIHVQRGGFHFYFPFTTCLLLSALARLAYWLYSRWNQ